MLENHSSITLIENPSEYVFASTDVELQRFDYEQIGIDEVRSLITEAHRKPSEKSIKQIVVTANKITSEAQQASLKILEEPPSSVRIKLVLPIGTQFLPTVLSRVRLETESAKNTSSVFEDWQMLSPAERIKVVEEKVKAKDVKWQQSLKNGLQTHLSSTHGYSAVVLSQLDLIVNELLTRGASNKMLLEHLALSLPLTAVNRK